MIDTKKCNYQSFLFFNYLLYSQKNANCAIYYVGYERFSNGVLIIAVPKLSKEEHSR